MRRNGDYKLAIVISYAHAKAILDCIKSLEALKRELNWIDSVDGNYLTDIKHSISEQIEQVDNIVKHEHEPEMNDNISRTDRTFLISGKEFYRNVVDSRDGKCPGCQQPRLSPHAYGCDHEYCPKCGEQLLFCEHDSEIEWQN